jgi:hypothetical protein
VRRAVGAAVLAAVAAAGCAKSKPKDTQDPTPVPPPVAAGADAAPAPAAAIDAAAAAVAPAGGPIPAESTVLITSVSADWDAVPTALTEYRRDDAGAWKQVRAWTGVLGHTGLGWGKGLHGAGAPAAPCRSRTSRRA